MCKRFMKWIVGFGHPNSTACSMYPPWEFSSPPGDGAEGLNRILKAIMLSRRLFATQGVWILELYETCPNISEHIRIILITIDELE